jgi:Tfp pilus assembly protein PilN
VTVRPNGAKLRGAIRIENFRDTPAAEWGAAYSALVSKAGMPHVAATVLLPRHDVILRQVALPGVAEKELDAAVSFQLDGLHPYDEADVTAAWGRLEGSDGVAVAIVRREVLDAYTTLFAEAGIKLAGFSCTGVAVHSALRLFGAAPGEGAFAAEPIDGGVEIYGESPSKPLFSAAFDVEPERAVALATAELRLENAPQPAALSTLVGGEPARPFAAALSSACPMLSNRLNLLARDLRQGRSAWRWAPTAALGGAVVLSAIGLAVLPIYRNGSYLGTLTKEIAKVQPLAARAGSIDKDVETARARTLLLDNLRLNSKRDMDVLASMTGLLPPPTWLQSMDISEAQVRVTGETEQAEPLLKLIDESPLFEGSEFASPPSRAQGVERFSLRTRRTGARP